MSQKRANRNATPKPRRERQRGRILTETGWNKLDAALQAWEVEQDCKRTFERIAAETQLDPGTIAKIFKRKEGADLGKLEQLFGTFQLTLEATDHRLVPQGMSPVADPNFVGRTQAIADLNRLIDRGTKVIVIQARGGVGKTALARKYLQQEFESILEFPIAKETKDVASIESLIEEKLRQLGEEPGREFFVSLDRLKRKLQTERIGILIDNLEPALDAAGKLIEPHRRYVELLRVLADPSVQAVTLITSRERLNEYSISVQHYLLEELSLEAWNQFFQHRFALSADDRDVSDTDCTALVSLHKAYGGNAKAMDILCGAVLTDYSSSIEAYWQANQNDLLIERALEDLVVGQFDRLQQLDSDAYNLLCRMGCYRYQDVPTVPIEGLLCLLWDVPENRQRRVVKSLQERSLVEFENSKYWLHPVIRAEAIRRLRTDEDWEETNLKAAEAWSMSVENDETVKDALKALEAYYHYINVSNVELACDVLIRIRNNERLKSLTLGGAFLRLGLYQQMNSAITQIVKKVRSNDHKSVLYDLLGHISSATGKIHRSVEYYEKIGEIAGKFKYSNMDLEISSLLGKGVCKIYLWEIIQAIEAFQISINLNNELSSKKILPKMSSYYVSREWQLVIAECYLAFAKSCLNPEETKHEIAYLSDLVYDKFLSSALDPMAIKKNYGLRGLVFLGLTYKSLGNISRAYELCHKVEAFAEDCHYTQTQAIALTGLAEIFREQKKFQEAIQNHSKSVKLLTNLGAKCELAEAHYQLGLTYQVMNELYKGNENFQEAIRLFTEMEAPRQVERVRQSMES